MDEKVVPVTQMQIQEVVKQVPRVMMQEVLRQVPRVMVQEVVKQVPVPQVQAVEKVVEVPELQVMEKIVEVPRVAQAPAPVITRSCDRHFCFLRCLLLAHGSLFARPLKRFIAFGLHFWRPCATYLVVLRSA